jgi:glucokinase
MPDHCLVFDLGGTTLRAGVYEPASDSLSRVARRPTPGFTGHVRESPATIYARVIAAMHELARGVLPEARPAVVSVAFPGPLDPRGNALAAPTVFGGMLRERLPVRDDLARTWPDARVLVMNDLTAAGYRYLRASDDDLCVVTVSSGIGHKVFVAGKPLIGPQGRGGEIGHLRVDFSPAAPVCDCGSPGHLAALASARGAQALARSRAAREPAAFRRSMLAGCVGDDPDALDTHTLVAAFHAGDAWASALIRDVARPLGRALAALHVGVGVERFVVIGGFALALGGRYRDELVGAMAASTWDLGTDWDAMVELGVNDDDAGLLGAGRCAVGLI